MFSIFSILLAICMSSLEKYLLKSSLIHPIVPSIFFPRKSGMSYDSIGLLFLDYGYGGRDGKSVLLLSLGLPDKISCKMQKISWDTVITWLKLLKFYKTKDKLSCYSYWFFWSFFDFTDGPTMISYGETNPDSFVLGSVYKTASQLSYMSGKFEL